MSDKLYILFAGCAECQKAGIVTGQGWIMFSWRSVNLLSYDSASLLFNSLDVILSLTCFILLRPRVVKARYNTFLTHWNFFNTRKVLDRMSTLLHFSSMHNLQLDLIVYIRFVEKMCSRGWINQCVTLTLLIWLNTTLFRNMHHMRPI